jgi:hypothetical protein
MHPMYSPNEANNFILRFANETQDIAMQLFNTVSENAYAVSKHRNSCGSRLSLLVALASGSEALFGTKKAEPSHGQ